MNFATMQSVTNAIVGQVKNLSRKINLKIICVTTVGVQVKRCYVLTAQEINIVQIVEKEKGGVNINKQKYNQTIDRCSINNSPCYGCGNREINCHSRCISYKGWVEGREREQKGIRQEIEMSGYLKDSIKRMKKKGKRKNARTKNQQIK